MFEISFKVASSGEARKILAIIELMTMDGTRHEQATNIESSNVVVGFEWLIEQLGVYVDICSNQVSSFSKEDEEEFIKLIKSTTRRLVEIRNELG